MTDTVIRRPYIVRDRLNPTVKARLVIASNPAQALRHVAQDVYDVEPASALEVTTLMTREGVKPEDPTAKEWIDGTAAA